MSEERGRKKRAWRRKKTSAAVPLPVQHSLMPKLCNILLVVRVRRLKRSFEVLARCAVCHPGLYFGCITPSLTMAKVNMGPVRPTGVKFDSVVPDTAAALLEPQRPHGARYNGATGPGMFGSTDEAQYGVWLVWWGVGLTAVMHSMGYPWQLAQGSGSVFVAFWCFHNMNRTMVVRSMLFTMAEFFFKDFDVAGSFRLPASGPVILACAPHNSQVRSCVSFSVRVICLGRAAKKKGVQAVLRFSFAC